MVGRLMRFQQAVHDYVKNGDFYPIAQLVIHRRQVDYFQSSQKYKSKFR
jgi:hypothetical protein